MEGPEAQCSLRRFAIKTGQGVKQDITRRSKWFNKIRSEPNDPVHNVYRVCIRPGWGPQEYGRRPSGSAKRRSKGDPAANFNSACFRKARVLPQLRRRRPNGIIPQPTRASRRHNLIWWVATNRPRRPQKLSAAVTNGIGSPQQEVAPDNAILASVPGLAVAFTSKSMRSRGSFAKRAQG